MDGMDGMTKESMARIFHDTLIRPHTHEPPSDGEGKNPIGWHKVEVLSFFLLLVISFCQFWQLVAVWVGFFVV